MLNSIVVVMMVFMSLRDDRRAPGEPHTGFFRMKEAGAPVDAPPGSEDQAEEWAEEWAEWADWARTGHAGDYGNNEGPRA